MLIYYQFLQGNKYFMKNDKTQQELQDFFRFNYLHIQQMPPSSIEQAVIFVSHDGQCKVGFEKITGLSCNLPKQPLMDTSLLQNTAVIYPTSAFLTPEFHHNFVSMHYLLKTIQRVKFVFVFNSNSIEMPMKTVKEAISRLFALTNTPDISGQELSKSCVMLITNAQTNKKDENYLTVLRQMTENNFIPDQPTRQFVSQLTCSKQKLMLLRKDKNYQQQFLKLLRNCEYLPINQSKDVALEKRIVTSYHKFVLENEEKTVNNVKITVERHLATRWEQMLKYLTAHLDVLILQALEGREDRDKTVQIQLQNKIQFFQIRNFQDNSIQAVNTATPSTRIVQFIISYLKLAQNSKKPDNEQSIVNSFFDILTQLNFISNPIIRYFFQSFFQIRRYLRKQTAQVNDDILQPVDWTKNIFILNNALRKLINYLLAHLPKQIQDTNSQHHFTLLVQELTSLIALLQDLKVNSCNFLTPRVVKKLVKFKAEIAFKKATVLADQFQKEKETIEAWIQFLQFSQDSPLISQKSIKQALNYIAHQLTLKHQFKLALLIYSIMPEHQSYSKIKQIYEQGMQFYPQILKYTLLQNWTQKEPYFVDYCNFLLRMGKNEQVRQLCLRGIQIMQLQDNPDHIQQFRKLLLNARPQNSREMHNSILQKELLDEPQFTVNKNLITEIKYKVQELF